MMTPQQAYRLFVYADWAMLLLGLVALGASIGWGVYAALPRNRGRRKRVLRTALLCFLVFAMFLGTQASVTTYFSSQGSPRYIVLFALPVVVMLTGLAASIVYGVYGILTRIGQQRSGAVWKSLLGMVVFGVGVAPHTLAMLIPILSAEDHSNHPGTLTQVGEPAPEFQVASIGGTPFNSNDLRGKVVVLNFFATWCGPCKMELPHLQALWEEFRDEDDFRMLGVGREETKESVKAFRQEHGFTIPMAADPDRLVYGKFASQSIPRTYLLSREGVIIHQFTGYYEDELSELKRLLSKELEERQ